MSRVLEQLRAVVHACALVAAACGTHPTEGGSQAGSGERPVPVDAAGAPQRAAATSVLEQVKRWAPATATVAPADLAVTGVELFTLTEREPPAEDAYARGTLVGVVGGLGGAIVQDRDLVRAVIAGKPEPRTLAQVALRVARRDDELVEVPTTPAQRKARIRPPVITREGLVFWVWTPEDGPRSTERGQLDLATGALDLHLLPVPRPEALKNAIGTLAGPSVRRHKQAIRALADACSDPLAEAALRQALMRHPLVRTRAAVADAMHRCGPAALSPLISAMERDASGLVRSAAATALGRIGDKGARTALAKAAKSEDANLVWAAQNALKKLP